MKTKYFKEFQNLFKFSKSKNSSYLFVHRNEVLDKNIVEKGVEVETKEKKDGLDVDLRVKKGCEISKPLHLCFGMLPKRGLQKININLIIEDNAKLKILAHCIFPNAEKIIHRMQAKLFIGKNAEFEYNEVHYHGEYGGTEVIPHLEGRMDENSRMKNEFSLIEGTVGRLDIDYCLDLKDNATCELLAKVYGKSKDEIRIKDTIHLNGAYSKGLAKSRVIVKDEAVSEVIGEIIANFPYSRGHVDCKEIVQDRGKAKAYPFVSVTNSKAKVTHEAAIGSIDKKQVQALMVKGLSENEAVDIIIRGLLR